MIAWYWLAVALAAGGFITSAVEYKLDYNLIDLLKDKILGWFGKVKAEEQKIVGKL